MRSQIEIEYWNFFKYLRAFASTRCMRCFASLVYTAARHGRQIKGKNFWNSSTNSQSRFTFKITHFALSRTLRTTSETTYLNGSCCRLSNKTRWRRGLTTTKTFWMWIQVENGGKVELINFQITNIIINAMKLPVINYCTGSWG